jgi:hypothetical protein
MSTDYKVEKNISMDHLFGDCLEVYGIKEAILEGKSSPECRYLTDGENGLVVLGDENVGIIKRCGTNIPNRILLAISDAFNTQIYSEFEPQFWGYESELEWDRAEQQMEAAMDMNAGSDTAARALEN